MTIRTLGEENSEPRGERERPWRAEQGKEIKKRDQEERRGECREGERTREGRSWRKKIGVKEERNYMTGWTRRERDGDDKVKEKGDGVRNGLEHA